MTIAAAAAEAARALEAAGVPADEARRDAARLARQPLGWTEAEWLTRRGEAEPAGFAAPFAAAVARRVRREPLAYILGEREFYGRMFNVAPDVLIPRPETELIIDEALLILASGTGRWALGTGPRTTHPAPRTTHPAPRTTHPAPRTTHDAPRTTFESAPVVVDVGTGSGCLAITIALECPDARVIATDSSAAALEVARENARRHDVADRIDFRRGDLLQPVGRPVSVILSNPPYVPESDRASLAPEVVDYEPASALFAGADGLDVIRALVPAAARTLAPGGIFIMEFGWGQSEAVTRLIEETPGLTLRHVRADLQGISRVIAAERTA